MKLNQILRKQSGFTAVELLVGIVIVAIVGVAAASVVTQTFGDTAFSNNRMTAINTLRNAGDWLTRDLRTAEVPVTLISSCPRMTWHDYDTGELRTVIYSKSGTNLLRSYQEGTGTPSVITVAQNITSIASINYYDGSTGVTLTAAVGDATESRSYIVMPRNIVQ
jgi:prepilin-type N-terminal cleavage/methylation domain-containing protein